MFQNLLDQFKNLLANVGEWMKPDPADAAIVQGIKFIFKGIVVLIGAALSPIALALLIFAFFAAL